MDVCAVEELEKTLGTQWSALRRARERSALELDRLQNACKELVTPDTSLVVFGSLARGEFTDASDIDWTLLVDGITIPEHLTVGRSIAVAIKELESKGPGRTGTFGNIASSHNLIHFIGGEDDTNANTTRRSLLLLEAKAVGADQAFTRVRNNILRRYLEEDLGLWRTSTKVKVPHFLLNDFARYWRTMTVDFADKQRDRFHEGFALRNIKLRLSRKLMYISGLLSCFRCHLDISDECERATFFRFDNALAVAERVNTYLDMTPLDLAASTFSQYVSKPEPIKGFFSAYDSFVEILSDPPKRKQLEELTPDKLESDPVYKQARDVSHRFADAIQAIFLTADNPVGDLTIKFGVF